MGAKPSVLTSDAILNHTLAVKTSGFADLSFIDFSCISFPRIAQNYCELWPRRLHLPQSQSNNGNSNNQPLHNYMCDKCGFYFPSKASLQLHKLKKTFAKTKLQVSESVIDDINKEPEEMCLDNSKNKKNGKITSRCQLFMTNSKYLDYEKTIDEIITKIENKSKQELESELEESGSNQADKSEFLKNFGLVHVNSLPIDNSKKSKLILDSSIIINTNKNLNLEDFINTNKPITINLNKNLLLKLRKQMLDINHQFVIDLDRWKFMHSNESMYNRNGNIHSNDANNQLAYYDPYSSKVNLKPHVNSSRPLLIRSKKLKRNAQKLLLQSITKSPIPQSKANSNKSPVKQANSTSTIFSKPFFNATSGNFSAAMAYNTKNQSKTMLTIGKKRKLIEIQNKNKQYHKEQEQQSKRNRKLKNKKYAKDDEDEDEEEEDEEEEDEINEDEDTNENDDEIEEDQEYNEPKTKRAYNKTSKKNKNGEREEVEDEEKDENDQIERINTKLVKSKTKVKRLQQSTSKPIIDAKNRDNKKQAMPQQQPPPLLKAPVHIVPTNTSANSSRLASASGMNIAKIMPKLQPIGAINNVNNSPNIVNNNNQNIMPKLKPQNSINHSHYSNTNNKLVNGNHFPQPPKLLPANKTNTNNKLSSDHFDIKLNPPKLMPAININNNNSNKYSETSSLSNSDSSNSNHNFNENDTIIKLKKSENISLKCKFCFQIFKGQSEFFHHIIVQHPKLLKNRLNRNNKNNNNKNYEKINQDAKLIETSSQ